ncbi:high nitrogen upregulated cytochrome P450 monooxygenase 2 [Pholiota conissans]|uniref:High nitrogen upregulated cytochrome P450 monooxygenase 2 n=1 Tax=Pholiota conissans TaxID=109636 RepID=A0A9P6CXW5_9AGAR|nr:high nitrogen upregulated cytochrome P450 monooxygenase 2 [Pholiota conissans]
MDPAFLTVVTSLILHLLFNEYEEDHLPFLKKLAIVLPLIPSYAFYQQLYGSLLWAACIGYIATYATLFSSIVLYRVSPFHPLARYPGPLLAKCSKLWALYQVSTGKMHLVFSELHEKYGPVVRTGPNELSISEVSVVEPALGVNGMPKGPMWNGRKNPKTGQASLVSERDTRVHLERRKPWNKGLSSASVREYEPILRNRLFQLVDAFEEKAKDGVFIDFAEWMSMFSYDFMGDMAFGGLGYELMRDGDVNGLWALMEHGIKIQAYTQHVPWANGLLHKISGMGKAAAKLRHFVFTTAQKRAQRGIGPTGPDLSSWLLDELNPTPHPLQFSIYAREAQLIIVAGSDTSAAVISSVFHHILSDKKYFYRLRKELDDIFPLKGGEIPADNSSKLSELPFLNAVINEALRLTPPVPIDLQRGPEKGSGGRMFGSIFVPEGTGVHIPPYIIQRDPRYFHPHPDRFLPERWLPDPAGTFTTRVDAFFPFSLGPMNCPGKGLALLELRVVVATLVHKFDMELKPGYDTTDWEKKLDCYFVLTRGVLPVELKVRAV